MSPRLSPGDIFVPYPYPYPFLSHTYVTPGLRASARPVCMSVDERGTA